MGESSILSLLLKLNDFSTDFFQKKQFDHRNYSLDNLKELEFLIAKNHLQFEKPSLEDAIPYGYFLGQMITNTIPYAFWDDLKFTEEFTEEMSISVSLPGVASKVMLFPMKRAIRFMVNHEDSIVSFYEVTKGIVERGLDVSGIKKGDVFQSQTFIFKVRSKENGKTSLEIQKFQKPEEEE